MIAAGLLIRAGIALHVFDAPERIGFSRVAEAIAPGIWLFAATMLPQILAMANFNEGQRYADFGSKTDKVATYGIAALVAGGVAAKMGLFKLAWVFILGAKKFLIIGFVAAAAWLKRLFSKGRRASS